MNRKIKFTKNKDGNIYDFCCIAFNLENRTNFLGQKINNTNKLILIQNFSDQVLKIQINWIQRDGAFNKNFQQIFEIKKGIIFDKIINGNIAIGVISLNSSTIKIIYEANSLKANSFIVNDYQEWYEYYYSYFKDKYSLIPLW